MFSAQDAVRQYGIAYSFAWDHEPEMIALNADDTSYIVGGELPLCLNDLSFDYEPEEELEDWAESDGWRIMDMENTDSIQDVASAEAIRWWGC